MISYLFVYGTLLDNENEFAELLRMNSSFVAKGKIKGKLFDIGEYPGAIVARDGSNYVYGSVLLIKNTERTLKVLDEYEDFGNDQEQPNLFVRELIDIETVSGNLKGWVYLYNLPVKGFTQIFSGKW